MNMGSEEITLVIEDIPVACQRKILVDNSDYFRAMLQGNFVESNKKHIKLESVSLKAVNIILTLLWDDTFIIGNEDLLPVLEAACMLQFLKIRSLCIDRLLETLSPCNCIKIWILTEQLDIIPLYLKAKCMALDEFSTIKELDSLVKLNLNMICLYLGHTCLIVKDEFDVFQTVMKWWYDNQKNYEHNDSIDILLKLLSCIDFNNLNILLIKEMLTYPDIADKGDICSVLNCVIDLKCENNSIQQERYQKIAQNLLDSKRRHRNEFLCILLNRTDFDGESKQEKQNLGKTDSSSIVIYDKFKRKRVCTVLDDKSLGGDLIVAHYDSYEQCFKHFFEIDESKCKSLDGFKIMGYKEFVFLFGGEHLLAKGNWSHKNYNFWVYDTFRERWERKTRLPYPRRHFESCIVDSTVYIVGGTGNFRIIQENIFWYNFKEDSWSKQINLPCSSRQIKCCNFLGQLFILSLSDGCGYFFNEVTSGWSRINIIDENEHLKDIFICTLFSYKDQLFIKGKSLIVLQRLDKDLVVTSAKYNSIIYEKMESVRCYADLFTLYQSRVDETTDTYTLERYNLETNELEFIFKSKSVTSNMELDNETYIISPLFKIFSFHHHSLVRENVLINDNFMFNS